MAVRRRVIWMSDDEWAWIRDRAVSEGMTVSALIRVTTALVAPIDEQTKALFGPNEPQAGVAALRSVPGFNSRPFTPVPKTRGR